MCIDNMGSWENGVWTWALKWRGWFVWEEQQVEELGNLLQNCNSRKEVRSFG